MCKRRVSKMVVDLDGCYENQYGLHLIRIRREAEMSKEKTARNLKFWFDWRAGMTERDLSAKYLLSLLYIKNLKRVLKQRY